MTMIDHFQDVQPKVVTAEEQKSTWSCRINISINGQQANARCDRSGTKIKVDNVHYELTEVDLRVREKACSPKQHL